MIKTIHKWNVEMPMQNDIMNLSGNLIRKIGYPAFLKTAECGRHQWRKSTSMYS